VSLSVDSDVDALLEWFPIEPLAVFRKGQLSRPTAKRVSEISGFNVLVSDHDGEHMRELVAEAEAFLERHREALVRLSRESEASLSLDFGTDFPEGAAARTHELPPALLRACGELEISIDVSVYRTSESED
jgi:hypothetical protein